jgi:hypothetical protein
MYAGFFPPIAMSELKQFLNPLGLGDAVAVDEAKSTDSSLYFSYKGRALELRHTHASFLELRDASEKCRLELFDTEIGSRLTPLNKATFLNAVGDSSEAAPKPSPKPKKQPASQVAPEGGEAE